MSSVEQDEACASCGKAAVDDVKLKKCACNLVKYCSVECQKNHRPQHKKACKKRMAEIHDKRIFSQPDGTHLGECPICCLPLSLDVRKTKIMTCCSKLVCLGCVHANWKHERELGLEPRCPFCREEMPATLAENEQRDKERAKANDPVALRQVAAKYYDTGDYKGAFELDEKAAELGFIESHFMLSQYFRDGKGVERDPQKARYHMEEAAIAGHDIARFNLAIEEAKNGRIGRALKHYIIAANLGEDMSMKKLREMHAVGIVNKEVYEGALRGYQAAIEATKSAQREEAYKHYKL
jgi:hypothetical protein